MNIVAGIAVGVIVLVAIWLFVILLEKVEKRK